MKLYDITLALVITSNVIISCHSATSYLYKRTDINPQKLILSDRRHLFRKDDLFEAHHLNRSLELIRKSRKDSVPKWNIEAIQTKLGIAVDKYKSCNKEIKELYRDIKSCGVSGCPNFNNFIPKPKHDPSTDYFKKRRRHFRKKVDQLLEKFRNGLQKIHKSYDDMLKFENSTRLHNKLRTELLKMLEEQIIVLKFEVEEKLKNRKGEMILNKDGKKEFAFPYPSNQTDLLIQEWYVIKASERYLTEWQKILYDLMMQTRHLYNRKQKGRKHDMIKVQKPRKRGRLHKMKKNLTMTNS